MTLVRELITSVMCQRRGCNTVKLSLGQTPGPPLREQGPLGTALANGEWSELLVCENWHGTLKVHDSLM